jgi:hypothetical protein
VRGAGVSTIVGGIILVAIILTTAIPLMLFINQAELNFNRFLSERRLFEDMRASEKLSATAYQDFSDGGRIKVYVRNVGGVPLTILRTWVVNRTSPANPYITTNNLFLNTFAPPQIINTGIIPLANRLYDVFLVTERGNIIVPSDSPILGQPVPPRPIDVMKFPFTLAVTLTNMRKGITYNLTLIGNIPGGVFTLIHKATARNTDVTLAFGVYPGDYTLIVEGYKGSRVLVRKTVTLTVPDILSVVVDVSVPALAEAVIEILAPDQVCEKELFTVMALITNVGTVDITGAKADLTIDKRDWDIRSRKSVPIRTLEVDEIVTVSWSVRAGRGSPATFTITLTGSTEQAFPVSVTNSTTVSSIRC